MDSRDARTLGWLVLAFGASRLLWLAWNPESAAYWEESQRWMVAHEILTGPRHPLVAYQADHYQGGTLVMPLLIAPFFVLFGESLVSVKLAALLVSTGTLCALYVVARLGSGRPAAVFAASGYVAGPPLVAYWGLIPFGSHGETILFTLVQFSLFLGLLSGRWRTPRGWLGFGLVAGVGIWFCYTSALGLAACGLTWLLLAGVPRLRELGCVVGGAALGLVPWLLYNLRYDFAGLARIFHLFGVGEPIDFWESQSVLDKLAALLGHDLPLGLLLPVENTLSAPWQTVLALAFITPVFLALALGARRAADVVRDAWRRPAPEGAGAGRLELLLLVYILVFATVFVVSDFVVWAEDGPVAYRLLLPLAVVLLLLVAVEAARAFERAGWRRVGAVAGGASYLAASAAGTALLAALPPDPDHEVALQRGYFVQGVLLHRMFEEDLRPALAWLHGLPDASSNVVLFGVGVGFEYRFAKDGRAEMLRERLRTLDGPERARVLIGIWRGLRYHAEGMRERRARGAETRRDRMFAPHLATLRELARAEAAAIPWQDWPPKPHRPPAALRSPREGTLE